MGQLGGLAVALGGSGGKEGGFDWQFSVLCLPASPSVCQRAMLASVTEPAPIQANASKSRVGLLTSCAVLALAIERLLLGRFRIRQGW